MPWLFWARPIYDLKESVREPMSARSTPVKGVPASPARSVRSTPGKSPLKSPGSSILGQTSSRPSSAIKASSEGSWNLEESNGKDINLETNVVNKAFQINKQLYGNDLDVNEEAREVEKLTAERRKMQTAKVEAFQTKTNARAEAAAKAARKKIRAVAAKTADPAVGAGAELSVSSARPSTAPADADSGMSRRLAIAAKKAAELALQTKPLVKKVRRTKKVAESLRSSKAEAELAAAIAKAASERGAQDARARAAARSRATAEKVAAEKAKKMSEVAAPVSAVRKARCERAPLDKPLARNIAEKTTAPRPLSSSFDIESTAIVQLSGLVGHDGTRYVGVDDAMVDGTCLHSASR